MELKVKIGINGRETDTLELQTLIADIEKNELVIMLKNKIEKMTLEEAHKEGIKQLKTTCKIENIDEFNELLAQLHETVDKINNFKFKFNYEPIEDVTHEQKHKFDINH